MLEVLFSVLLFPKFELPFLRFIQDQTLLNPGQNNGKMTMY